MLCYLPVEYVYPLVFIFWIYLTKRKINVINIMENMINNQMQPLTTLYCQHIFLFLWNYFRNSIYSAYTGCLESYLLFGKFNLFSFSNTVPQFFSAIILFTDQFSLCIFWIILLLWKVLAFINCHDCLMSVSVLASYRI